MACVNFIDYDDHDCSGRYTVVTYNLYMCASLTNERGEYKLKLGFSLLPQGSQRIIETFTFSFLYPSQRNAVYIISFQVGHRRAKTVQKLTYTHTPFLSFFSYVIPNFGNWAQLNVRAAPFSPAGRAGLYKQLIKTGQAFYSKYVIARYAIICSSRRASKKEERERGAEEDIDMLLRE